jgi:hypothetical protein
MCHGVEIEPAGGKGRATRQPAEELEGNQGPQALHAPTAVLVGPAAPADAKVSEGELGGGHQLDLVDPVDLRRIVDDPGRPAGQERVGREMDPQPRPFVKVTLDGIWMRLKAPEAWAMAMNKHPCERRAQSVEPHLV